MRKEKLILIVIIGLLVISNVFFILAYGKAARELKETSARVLAQDSNKRILDFARLFIQKVLKSETEIDFETRLLLENSVRAGNDPDILAQWQRFSNSKNEADAQKAVKDLLGVLIEKLRG